MSTRGAVSIEQRSGNASLGHLVDYTAVHSAGRPQIADFSKFALCPLVGRGGLEITFNLGVNY